MQCFELSEDQKIKKRSTQMMLESILQAKCEKKKAPCFMILSKEEFQNIKGYFPISPAMLKEWLEKDEVAQLEAYAKYDLGIVQKITWHYEKFISEVIHFMIGKNYLLIIVEEEYPWLIELISNLQEDEAMPYTLGYIFYRIIDCVIAKDREYLEQLAKKTAQLEEDILNEVARRFVEEIIEVRKQITFFKNHYDPLSDIVEDLMSNNEAMCHEEDIRYYKILNNRINRLSHLIEQIDDYTTHVREAYDAQIDIQQNRIMKYFTLITSVFLPLTLIVGWYGMNFTTMPEISWKYGYYYVIVLTVMSSMLCLYYFKKKKWF